jgi:iron-sulfur cluster assembly protein
MNPIIKLSDNAALRIKEIMSNAEKDSLGVRVSVKSWWLCRYVLRYGIY